MEKDEHTRVVPNNGKQTLAANNIGWVRNLKITKPPCKFVEAG
jgi:hypothetical protein